MLSSARYGHCVGSSVLIAAAIVLVVCIDANDPLVEPPLRFATTFARAGANDSVACAKLRVVSDRSFDAAHALVGVRGGASVLTIAQRGVLLRLRQGSVVVDPAFHIVLASNGSERRLNMTAFADDARVFVSECFV